MPSFFWNKEKLKSYEKVCKNKDFRGIVMSSEKDNLLKFNQHINSDKMPNITHADLECLIKKIDGCVSNPEKSSATKLGEHILCGYSMSTIWSFDNIENKHTFYCREDCIEKYFFKRTCYKCN